MSPRGIPARIRFAAAAALSVTLLLLLLWHADPSEVLGKLREASLVGVGLVLLTHLGSILLRVRRWRILVEASDCAPPEGTHRWLIFDSLFFGWLCNLVLPARVGELARPGMYSRGTGLPFSRVLATSVVERVADLAVVAGAAWVALALLPLPEGGLSPAVRSGALVAGLVALGAVVALAVVAARSTGEPSPRFGRLGSQVVRFREGLAVLRKPRTAARIFGGTALIWFLEVLCVWIAMDAFGLEPSWSAATCQVVAVTLSIAVVTVPAGLGVEQGVTIGVLAAWSIGESDALAMSFVLTFAAVFWVVPFGLLALVRQGGTVEPPD